MRLAFFFPLICLLSSFPGVLAQSESRLTTASCLVSGRIIDTSGAVVPEAVLLVEPSSKTFTTNRHGGYCIPESAGPIERIMVGAAGFEEMWRSFAEEQGSPLTWNVTLRPAGTSETVTVTATRTQKRLDDVPVRTEVIGLDLIHRTASRTLAEAVEFTPGIRVDNNCQNCNFTSLRLLGLEGPYTQILFDGQPTMSSLAQVYGVEHVPTRMIDRIEVVKGGGSAIYGPGSVGGVVNIISRQPSDTGGYLEGRMEWADGQPSHSLGMAADWVSKDRDTYLTLFGQRDKVQPLDLTGDGFTEIGKRRFQAMGVRFGQSLLEERGRLTLDLNQIREERRGGDRLDLPEHQAEIAESALTRRYAGGVSWYHMPDTSLDYRLGVSFARTKRGTYYGAGMDPNAYGNSLNPLLVFDSQVNHYLDSHILSWGGQLTFDSLEDAQPDYSRMIDQDHRNLGFFLQDDWFFLPGWELVYGVRLDNHSEIDDPIVSPRVAVMWTGIPGVTLRGSVARGFLAPQVFDEDLHITQVGGEGAVIRNHSDLKEETSSTYMLGGEWKPSAGHGVLLLECNLFYTRIDDLFSVGEDDNPATPDLEFTRVNLGHAKVYGAEFNVGYALPDKLELQFGLVEQRSRYGQPEPDFGSLDFFKTPDRYGILTILYQNRDWFDLFAGVSFSGSMVLPHYAGFIDQDKLERTPSYASVDLSISRGFPLLGDSGTRISIGTKNLTNRYQNDLDQGPERDAGYLWGPRYPRTFYVSCGWDF